MTKSEPSVGRLTRRRQHTLAALGASTLLLALPAAADTTGEPQPPPLFTDITAAAGIDFVHTNGAYGQKFLPETMGGGVAFFDYDRDGDADLLFVNSDDWPDTPRVADSPAPVSRLYRNRGDGRFEDVTAATGLDLRLYGMGVAVGDYDGDGWEDLYITALGGNRLLRNDGGRRFVDATAAAGVAGGSEDWTTAAAFVDLDRDGDLDLVALNYVEWSESFDLANPFHIMGIGRSFGAPVNYRGSQPLLFENTGDGRFRDRSATLALTDSRGEPVAKGLGLAILDLEDDGLPDLLVASDSTRNVLYRNLGEWRFREDGAAAGIAFDSRGGTTAAMGVDSAWRPDGLLQVAIGNFTWEESSYFIHEPGSDFADESALSGFGPATRDSLTFAVLFFDYDLDGVADLLHANGHLEPEIGRVATDLAYAQPPQLFRGCAGDGCETPFVEVDPGPDFAEPMVARGAAVADIDADGDLDVVLTQPGGAPRLLRNEQRSGNHWLRLRLLEAGRPALGAEAELVVDGRRIRQRLEVSRGYLSSVEPVLTFGLGRADRVDSLQLRWPDGSVQQVAVPAVDRTITVQREAGERQSAPPKTPADP